MHIQYMIIDAPPGQVLIAEAREGLVYVSFGTDGLQSLTAYAKKWFKEIQIVPSIVNSANQFFEYFEGQRTTFDVPFLLKGTDFQQDIWKRLLAIPFGQTTTYGALAQAVDSPGSARAVGQACGANPISIVVPCHRVLTGSGTLGGYGGGLDKKEWLLRHEGAWGA